MSGGLIDGSSYFAVQYPPFFFMEAVEGTICLHPEIPNDVWATRMPMTIRDLALLMVQLSAKQFWEVGSPTLGVEDQIIIGPLQSRHRFEFAGAELGPYPTSGDLKLAQLEHKLRLVREKCLQWTPGTRLESDVDPVWTYVLTLEMRDHVRGCSELFEEQPTYLRHLDDQVAQYYVRDDGSLAAVLDWEL